MRRAAFVSLVLSALTLIPPSVMAQGAMPVSRSVGTIEFGARVVSVDGDEARFNRYRDWRTGPTVDRFSHSLERGLWLIETSADQVGYRDQRYAAAAERPGRFHVAFVWDQVPLFLSESTRTPYARDASGALRLPDGVQESVEAGS